MSAETDTAVTLANDLKCILSQCQRERPDLFPRDADKAALAALAHRLAGHLGPLISGRYIPHRYAIQALEIQKRNAAVHAAFTGANHAELVKKFGISRRLVYSILAQRKKTGA